MMLPLQSDVRSRLQQVLTTTLKLPPDEQPPIPIETPPRRAMGDMSVPVAFELAKRLRKAPRAIAQELAAALGPIAGVTRVEAAPNGYLNLFLDRAYWVNQWLSSGRKPAAAMSDRKKTIVEHTAINPNKAAHIGHLRNATTGDAFGRLLRF